MSKEHVIVVDLSEAWMIFEPEPGVTAAVFYISYCQIWIDANANRFSKIANKVLK